MAHLTSTALDVQSSLPSSSYRALGWTSRVTRIFPVTKSKSVLVRNVRGGIAYVSTAPASKLNSNATVEPLTAPPLESPVGEKWEHWEIMKIADADVDAADQTTWLPTGENSGFKISVKRRDVPVAVKRVESTGEGDGNTSAWDILTRAFQKPSASSDAIIEEPSSSPALWEIKGGADPVQFVLVRFVTPFGFVHQKCFPIVPLQTWQVKLKSPFLCLIPCSAALIFVWWLGNYFVPDVVFRNTVFKDQSKDSPLSSDSSGSSSAEPSKEMPTATGFAQTAERARKKARKSNRG